MTYDVRARARGERRTDHATGKKDGRQEDAHKERSSKGELIDTGTDKRYVRRSPTGTFKESNDVGKSLAADRRTKAKTIAKKGQKHRGD